MSRLRRDCIARLCTADHHDDPVRIADWVGDASGAKFVRLLENPSARLVVATLDDSILGLAGFCDDLVNLNYVDPDFRFRGVSTALMDHVETQMAAHGIVTARLFSTATAHQFYQARGWQDLGVGNPVRGIPMGKQLPVFSN